MDSRSSLDGCENSRVPTGIRSSDHPACSESLYRLRYPGPQVGHSLFDVILTVHRRSYVEIKCQLDVTEVFIADLIAC